MAKSGFIASEEKSTGEPFKIFPCSGTDITFYTNIFSGALKNIRLRIDNTSNTISFILYKISLLTRTLARLTGKLTHSITQNSISSQIYKAELLPEQKI